MSEDDIRRATITIPATSGRFNKANQPSIYYTEEGTELWRFSAAVQGMRQKSQYDYFLQVAAAKVPENNPPKIGGVYDVILKKASQKSHHDNPDPPDWAWNWYIEEWQPEGIPVAPTPTPSTPVATTSGASASTQVRLLSHTEAKALDEWHKDRRTALMYSVEYMKIEAKDAGHEQNLAEIREGFWRWLRQEDGSVMPEEEGA